MLNSADDFFSSSHHQNLMADGINGPLIIHSPRDPLKRYIDYDQDVVLMLADWYHKLSGFLEV
jgi:FtsP/CotA-like multicopper oxidase with cupredoxin domain